MTRALHRDDLRADVLEGAATPIARHGYHGMSMRDLAKATGKSLASFYHLFESKEEILFELQSQAFERLISTAERALVEVHDPVGQLQIFVLNHVRYFAEQPDVMRVLVHEAAALPKSHRALIRALKQRYFEIARDIVRALVTPDRGVDGLELERITYSVFGMLNWIYGWYEPARHGPPEQLARTIQHLALHGIDARGAAPPASDRDAGAPGPTDAGWDTVVSALDGIQRLPLLRGSAETGGSR
ncbi:MAG TPA: TetR/AcrR family transcriptional regulator [Kofleriaceae bacterium]|nr:TetR/AcrR family transcriptional regulator [Kofleriaceae bacterium]